jgi:seryl-tRNA synthetase
MLDIKRIRNDFDGVKKLIEKRGKGDFGLAEVVKLDEKRRELIGEVEQMKNRQNTVSKEIPKLKKEGKDVSEILEEMRELSNTIKDMDKRSRRCYKGKAPQHTKYPSS